MLYSLGARLDPSPSAPSQPLSGHALIQRKGYNGPRIGPQYPPGRVSKHVPYRGHAARFSADAARRSLGWLERQREGRIAVLLRPSCTQTTICSNHWLDIMCVGDHTDTLPASCFPMRLAVFSPRCVATRGEPSAHARSERERSSLPGRGQSVQSLATPSAAAHDTHPHHPSPQGSDQRAGGHLTYTPRPLASK
jgi:hypothetical protein